MRILRSTIAAIVLAGALFAQQPFLLKSGDRVVFYGDSITDQRLYTTFAESYVLTRFPTLNVSFTHSGWGGDRVGGGGGGPIDTRLDRDVFPYKPTVLTIMLGMNDGGYKALDPGLFDKYKAGMTHIVETVKQRQPDCRITLIQPSAYDDVTRAPLFEGGYNAVLIRYSDFLKELATAEKLNVADLNTPVVEMLKRANTADAEKAASIIKDRVHPGPAGHLVMAAGLLKSWNAPATVTYVSIDAVTLTAQAKNATVTNIGKGTGIHWDELDQALPFPIDPQDALVNFAADSSDVIAALDQEILRVQGLAGKQELRIDGAAVASFTGQQLAEGVNLARLATPMLRQALQVHQLTVDRAAAHNIRWRQIQVPLKDVPEKEKTAALTALDNLDRSIARNQRNAAQPRSHHFEIIPVQ